MATATLIPSAYYVSSTYLTVADETNMYHDTSNTTYTTITNTNASTSYYYFYLRGFNIGSIPSDAEVSSFSVKIRGRASGAYNAKMYLAHGTTTITDASATALPNSSTVTTRTFTNGDLTWADIVSYGSDFGIRINCRRNAKNTTAWWRVYGAEIDVTYTVPVPQTDKLYFKNNGSWVEASKAYKKVNGIWVEQGDLTTVFDANTNYVRG